MLRRGSFVFCSLFIDKPATLRRRFSGTFLLMATVVLIVSCSANTKMVDANHPQSVSLLDELGKLAARHKKVTNLVVRYNPARIQCPEFEILLEKRWVRVKLNDLDEKNAPAYKLRERARVDIAAGRLLRYAIKGKLSSEPLVCGKGALYLEASIDSSK
jgi:hypothetical protein